MRKGLSFRPRIPDASRRPAGNSLVAVYIGQCSVRLRAWPFSAIIGPMKREPYLPWIIFGLAAGAVVYIAVELVGVGLVKRNAQSLGAIAAIFCFGLRFVRFRPPTSDRARRHANLTESSRAVLLLFLALAVIAAVALSVTQVVQGYPNLDAQQLITADEELKMDFFAAQGKPVETAIYEMQGSEGRHFLVALEGYEGRVLVMLDEKPSSEAIRVTGKLRTDVRTVQTGEDGSVEGPFLRLYRQHMNIPENARIYFLDTGIRAGLNVTTILLVLIPLFFFLLVQGSPTRKRGLSMRPRTR